MCVKSFIAIYRKEFGYVFDNHKHCRYVQRAEDASLYQSSEVVNAVLHAYDFKPGDYELHDIPVVVLNDVPEAENLLVVSLKNGESTVDVASVGLPSNRVKALAEMQNFSRLLNLVFGRGV